MLLELRDGGIEDIQTDEEHFDGCETCDYGSQYINYFDIKLTQYKIHSEVNQMYNFRFSSGDLLNIILPNIDRIKQMTELEFSEFMKEKLSTKRSPHDEMINFTAKFEVTKI